MATEGPAPLNVGALRNDWSKAVDELHAEPASVETPTENAAPAEPTPEAVPAVPAESASPEGSNLSDQQPAVSAPDDAVQHALDLAGAKDVPETERQAALARKLVEFNTRLAEQARELKALRGAPPPETAATEPAAPATQPTAVPPVQAQPPVQTAPVAQTEPDTAIEQEVAKHADSDETCRAFAAQYDNTTKRLAELVSYDAAGNFVGELPALKQKIDSINNLLNPPEAIKARIAPLDPTDEAVLRDELRALTLDHSALRMEARELKAVKKDLRSQWEGRVNEIREHIRAPYEKQKRDAETESYVNEQAQVIKGEFHAAFDAAAKAHGITDPADLKELRETLRAKANLDISCFDNPQTLGAFMDGGFKAEVARMDRYHRAQSKKYAETKIGDARQDAPPASAAVAPPLPTQSPDWEKALKAHARAEIRSRV